MILRLAILAAAAAFAHGDLHEQIEALNKAIKLSPLNADLYVKRGELRRMHRDWPAAQADFQRALALDAKDTAAILGQARLAADRGAIVPAVSLLTSYLAAETGSEVAYALRADLRARLSLYGPAAEDYAAAIRRSADPSIDYFLGQADALALARQDTAALAVIAAAVTRFGPLVTLDQWAVDFFVKRHRWDEALSRHQPLVASAPRKESALTRHAEILAAAGQQSQAQATFRDALAAWQQLPDQHRQTPAMRALRSRIDAGLTVPVLRSPHTSSR